MAGRRDAGGIKQLLGKMRNPDADFRFMALNDLISECSRSSDSFQADELTEKQTVDLVLELVNDKNTEVKNQAVKALGVLVKKVGDPRMTTIVDRLVVYAGSGDDQQRDLAGLALKTVIAEIGPSSRLAPTLCAKLAPKLIGQISDSTASPDTLCAALDALADLFARFEAHFRSNGVIQSQALAALVPLLSSSRPAVSKRAVAALGNLCASGGEDVFTQLVERTILPSLRSPSGVLAKSAVSLVGVLAKTGPSRMARTMPEFVNVIAPCARSTDEELRELALQAMEQIVLKCPTESTPSAAVIVDASLAGLKYDPNYTGADDADDEDVSMDEEEEDEDEDEDEFGDEYSDDDDVSWKIRRASAKLLASVIATWPALLPTFYKTVAPALVSKFAEREESVRIEIWTVYTVLLKQTHSHALSKTWPSGAPESSLKRKRQSTGDAGRDDPVALLRGQAPSVSKSIVKLLGAKSVQVRLAGFALLSELVTVLDGGLEGHAKALVARVDAALTSIDAGVSGSSTNLRISVLSFLALFFAKHDARAYTPELPQFVALLARAAHDKFHRVAGEAFVAASALVKALRPPASPASAVSGPSEPMMTICDTVLERLRSPSADQDVKECATGCLAEILTIAGDDVADRATAALQALSTRLDNEVTRAGAVRACTQVAGSKTLPASLLDDWIGSILPTMASFLRKNNRTLKMATFRGLEALLQDPRRSCSAATSVLLASELRPIIAALDLQLLPLAVSTLAAVIRRSPEMDPSERRQAVAQAIDTVLSTAVQGTADDALLAAVVALTEAGQPPKETVSLLCSKVSVSVDVDSIKAGGLQPYFTVARCVGAVVAESPNAAQDLVKDLSAPLATRNVPTTRVFLSLLIIGECGRREVPIVSDRTLFDRSLALFGSPSEDIRTAAAFAVGNLAAGSPDKFIGTVIEQVHGEEKRRYLALQALKEVIVNSKQSDLSAFGESLWDPLFDICEAEGDAARNVAAECLGKLSISEPASYLPRLQARLRSLSIRSRLTSMSALRFTLTDTSSTFDEELAPFLVDFLSHIHDADLGVRAIALSALNSAAHNKPSMLIDVLPSLLPGLYAETVVDPKLVRYVEMGPFKHRVDDGLETRKLAYASMLTLLDTCLAKIDTDEFLSRVLAGLADEEDIKIVCYLMLIRLSSVAPAVVTPRLDEAVDSFSQTLSATVKDDAVKQDRERVVELQRAAVRALAALKKLATPASAPRLSQLIRDASHKYAAQLNESD